MKKKINFLKNKIIFLKKEIDYLYEKVKVRRKSALILLKNYISTREITKLKRPSFFMRLKSRQPRPKPTLLPKPKITNEYQVIK